MYLYLSVILLTMIFALFSNDKNKKVQVFVIMSLLTLIAGLRHYTIGSDTLAYLRNFNRMVYYGNEYFEIARFEIGYVLLQYAVIKIFANFNVFLFVCAAFINYSFGSMICKYSKKPLLSVLLFILLRYFFGEMNILREYLAVAILLLSLKHVCNRKIVPFLIMILLASTFHTSALFAIPIYFLYDKEITFKNKIIISAVTGIIYLFLGNVLIYITSRIGIYNNYVELFINSNKLGNLLEILISICIYIFIKKLYKIYKENIKETEIKFYNFLINISFIIIPLQIISYKISVFNRLVTYYSIFNILIISNFLYLIKDKKKRFLIQTIIIVLFFAYFGIITYYRPEWNKVFPYKFFWE